MHYAPINASDLTSVTDAYRHRVAPPQVAGYEGGGTVIAAPHSFQHLIGQRVLPLRGVGCWQHFVDIDPLLAIPVPDDIASTLAATAQQRVWRSGDFPFGRVASGARPFSIITSRGGHASLCCVWTRERG